MNRAVLLSMAMLASAASASEKKTYSYICKGGNFTVTAVVDSTGQATDGARPSRSFSGSAPSRRKLFLPIRTHPMPTVTKIKTTNSMR
jgi:hypothetical protein